jgi:hypothetical protein
MALPSASFMRNARALSSGQVWTPPSLATVTRQTLELSGAKVLTWEMSCFSFADIPRATLSETSEPSLECTSTLASSSACVDLNSLSNRNDQCQ